jgi:hypothetical protein
MDRRQKIKIALPSMFDSLSRILLLGEEVRDKLST